MENLKAFYGTYKGMIGECMFRLANEKIILTRFAHKKPIIKKYKKILKKQKARFLKRNWHSIDALEFQQDKIILYEIKTKNAFKNRFSRPKMTLHSQKVYEQAKILGFEVRLVFVILHNNWQYEIRRLAFKKRYYRIDKPKRFDKGSNVGKNRPAIARILRKVYGLAGI